MFTADGALAFVGVACVRSGVVISAYLDGPLYTRLRADILGTIFKKKKFYNAYTSTIGLFWNVFKTNFLIRNYMKPSRPRAIPPKKKQHFHRKCNSTTIFEILNILNFPKLVVQSVM